VIIVEILLERICLVPAGLADETERYLNLLLVMIPAY